MPSGDEGNAEVRIAIDSRELVGRPTGVGRYLSELLTAWADLPAAGAHEFILCAPERVDHARYKNLRLSSVVSPGSGTLWEQRVLPKLVTSSRADVLFSPAYTCPLWGTPPTALVIEVIYLGASWLHQATAGETRAPLVLFVGSLFDRRHIPELIDGFRRVAARLPEARLEIVGDNRTNPRIDVDQLIAASGVSDRIHWRSYIPDADLAALYAAASAFAFLSDYEGFGLTPLEARAAGIPNVVLDTPIAREIYGGAAEYLERPDPELIARALERVLLPGEARTRLIDAGALQVQRYSWRECAQRTLQILLTTR
jgi:glycosyltransferase involved in cell wall biosynthesis